MSSSIIDIYSMVSIMSTIIETIDYTYLDKLPLCILPHIYQSNATLLKSSPSGTGQSLIHCISFTCHPERSSFLRYSLISGNKLSLSDLFFNGLLAKIVLALTNSLNFLKHQHFFCCMYYHCI